MQCLMRERWVRGTPLELRVYPPEGEPVAFSGLVVWTKAASGPEPQHRIGIRFETHASRQMGTLLRLLTASGSLIGGPRP